MPVIRETPSDLLGQLLEAKGKYWSHLRAIDALYASGSSRGESLPHSKTVGASESETLADGEIRPGAADPDSPEGLALTSYIRWKGLDNAPHRTYQRDDGIAKPATHELSADNHYSKNGFLTFVRESIREASSTGIQAQAS